MKFSLIKNIKKAHWHCSDEAINSPMVLDNEENSLVIPGYFPMKVDCQIGWKCVRCKEVVTFFYPVKVDSPKVIDLNPPDDKKYDKKVLAAISTLFNDIIFFQGKKLSYLMDINTKVSPFLIYTTCNHCSIQYLLFYNIGVGQYLRPPKPNRFVIKTLVAFEGDNLLPFVK